MFSAGKKKIIVKSYLLQVIQKMMTLLKEEYSIESTIKFGDDSNINKLRYYYLEIDNAESLIDEYHMMPFDELTIDNPLIANDCCQSSFIAGLFIARGSINDPRKNCYHLEISTKNEEISLIVIQILRNYGIDAKIRLRKDIYTVYIKRSEDISSCLAYMGANSGVFYFEDSRIVRDIANMANRMANCDIANVKKSSDAAQKQLKAIAYIRKIGHFYKLSTRLQTMAVMREDYPDSTLDELSEFSDNYFGKTLSKSGISHCLRSLVSTYEELKHKK